MLDVNSVCKMSLASNLQCLLKIALIQDSCTSHIYSSRLISQECPSHYCPFANLNQSSLPFSSFDNKFKLHVLPWNIICISDGIYIKNVKRILTPILYDSTPKRANTSWEFATLWLWNNTYVHYSLNVQISVIFKA